jgi:hypothetical protein
VLATVNHPSEGAVVWAASRGLSTLAMP